ncbi:MAG TPA: hypothetical protein VK616_13945 [Flavitalea sp.]|nr:hypothetical protein [Flavitalea sp.]
MAGSEQQFIDLCKKQIEQKFSFGNGHGYTQRDLEMLSAYIEEEAGVIISLSTLKRLWKNNYKQSPQLATLNALAVILGHKDWQDFKQANRKKPDSAMIILRWAMPCVALLIIVIWGVFFGFSSGSGNSSTAKKIAKPPRVTGPVLFQASKTVASGIPNTVIFKYDVSNVIADTFYIQQSWNEDHRVSIDPDGDAVTSIYYESGFHNARLIANDSVIARQPIHIISNGWEPHVYNSDSDPELIDFKNEKFISNGRLHLDSSVLAKRNIDLSKKFHSRITNSQVFDVHSDNFSFFTRMKVDSILDLHCPWMDLIIVTDVQTFMISLAKKGCEKYAAYKLGEISKAGANTDLSGLGCHIYDWQELELRVKDKQAAIYLNDKLTYQEVYKEDMGKVVALIYIFGGTGSIDHARLKDGNGKIIFEDDFER